MKVWPLFPVAFGAALLPPLFGLALPALFRPQADDELTHREIVWSQQLQSPGRSQGLAGWLP